MDHIDQRRMQAIIRDQDNLLLDADRLTQEQLADMESDVLSSEDDTPYPPLPRQCQITVRSITNLPTRGPSTSNLFARTGEQRRR